MDRRFLDKEVKELEVGRLYNSQWNGEFFFKGMRNDYLATFEKAIYDDDDVNFENPINSHEEYYFTPSECRGEGWIR
ncbi:MAG: hypothetical protein IJX30_03495 [Clostridia bacterium]|nr:hypothetical protein [Clostridia bacterium]